MTNSSEGDIPSLAKIAEKSMQERGFFTHFPAPALDQLSSITKENPIPSKIVRDMRSCLWISIDNEDTFDLDQLTYAESENGIDKLYVAVADVDTSVQSNTPIDHYAWHNTTSVYTPTLIFPMLPLKLSTDITSLSERADRKAIVIEIVVDKEGHYTLSDVYPAIVHNHAKLAYNSVAAWLDRDKITLFPGVSTVNFADQLLLQDRIAQRIKKYRYSQGSIGFGIPEIQPVIVNGIPVELVETRHNKAHALIENCMIAANVAATEYLMKCKMPTLRRIVRTPKRWDRIVTIAKERGYKLSSTPSPKALRDFLQKERKVSPDTFQDLSLAMIKLIGKGEYAVGIPGQVPEGHFDLAQRDYAHTTAPNRRFPDLIMQRLLKSCFYNTPVPYTNDELIAIAERCTLKESDATKVERRVRKSAAAMVLKPFIGKSYEAIVSGASDKGTWVRLKSPPIEGKLIKGYKGVDVGDKIRVELTDVDVAQGFIDFTKL